MGRRNIGPRLKTLVRTGILIVSHWCHKSEHHMTGLNFTMAVVKQTIWLYVQTHFTQWAFLPFFAKKKPCKKCHYM